MITINKLFLIFVFTLLPSYLFSQAPQAYLESYKANINGIFLGKKYTKSEIIQKYGNPDKYSIVQDEFDGVDEIFTYGTTEFFFYNGYIASFIIESNLFKVNDVVYIGMNINNISSLLSGFGTIKTEKDRYGKLCVFFNPKLEISVGNSDDSICFYSNSSGIITKIAFEVMD
jgi:hypothetical protein